MLQETDALTNIIHSVLAHFNRDIGAHLFTAEATRSEESPMSRSRRSKKAQKKKYRTLLKRCRGYKRRYLSKVDECVGLQAEIDSLTTKCVGLQDEIDSLTTKLNNSRYVLLTQRPLIVQCQLY